MHFEIVSDFAELKTIATGNAIREINRLRKIYGTGRWQKLKGIATIRLENGRICTAEIHWYEAHSIGKKEFKIKRIFD